MENNPEKEINTSNVTNTPLETQDNKIEFAVEGSELEITKDKIQEIKSPSKPKLLNFKIYNSKFFQMIKKSKRNEKCIKRIIFGLVMFLMCSLMFILFSQLNSN